MNLASTDLNQYVMQQMGVIIAQKPQVVVDLLNANEIPLDLENSLDCIYLTDEYLEYLPTNDSLKLGTAYLVNRLEESNFSGTANNRQIKQYYSAIDDFWNEPNEEKSNWVGAVAGALQSGAELGKVIAENKGKKKFFGSDLAEKQATSRQAIISGIVSQKQQEALKKNKENSQKKIKIVVGVLIGVALLIGTIAIVKMKNK